MKFIKSVKKTMLVISCIYITVGIIILVSKENSHDLVMKIMAYGLGVAGILSMIRYFMINVKERIKRSDFIVGSLLLSITALLTIAKNNMIGLALDILAIAMIISGLHKIQDLFDTKACGKGATSLYLFGFFICAGLGILILTNVITSTTLIYVVIGLGMCVCGISDLVSNFYVASCVTYLDEPVKEKEIVEEVVEEPIEVVKEIEETKETEEAEEDKPLE